MGVYLSSPNTEKISANRTFGKYSYGVSSMQGWRMTQEDSHNCIPDFDPETETSFFAVYDGHGGAEVAQYTSAKLPDFLKSTLEYKDGLLGEALQQAFMGFDATLRDDEVIKELKALAGVDDDADEDDDECDPVGRTEADLLKAEADIPIEELVAKYGDGMTSIPARKFKKDNKDEKFLSPMIKAKQSQQKGATTSKDAEENVNNSNSSEKNNSAGSSGVVDPLVTRLDDKLANGHADNDNNLNTEKELREAESVKSDKIEEMDTSKEIKQKSVKDTIDSCLPDSSDLINNVETVNNGKTGNSAISNIDSNEADSTSVNDLKDSKVSAKSSEGEISQEADESRPSSSSDGPSGSGCEAGSSGSGEPSGSSGGPTKMDAEPSGSGDGPSGVGSSDHAGSSGEGQSGSGSEEGKKKEKTTVDEGLDDEDDSSEEDDEYMEDSEEEDDDEDEDDSEDDEEELGEEEKERIGGIFSKVIAGEDDDGHIEEPGSDSGCTAVVALLRKNSLVVANAGDSRCVLCRNGEPIDLSVDHKPEDDEERKRIEGAGGKVTADGRVNGGLNLSRAIGDHWYKRNDDVLPQEQMISAWPDIQTETLGEQDEFIVIACDGIWNYMTSQEVVDFVRHRLQEEDKRKQLSLICEELFDHCLAPNTMGDGTGCDNMTCLIVLLNYKPTASTPVLTDSSEADSSTTDDAQPRKETDTNDTEAKQKSSSTENEKQENNGSEKRARESTSEEGMSEAEAQPEKRAKLEDTTVT